MGQEIERKFRVTGDGWRSGQRVRICQGYLRLDAACTVRVRLKETNDGKHAQAYITIKGKTEGATRPEYEYEIPTDDAQELLEQFCQRPLIEKHRYVLQDAGMTWEVDEFLGENAGLVVAEVELTDADQTFEQPDWLGEEVTDDSRYFNAMLTQHPYSQW